MSGRQEEENNGKAISFHPLLLALFFLKKKNEKEIKSKNHFSLLAMHTLREFISFFFPFNSTFSTPFSSHRNHSFIHIAFAKQQTCTYTQNISSLEIHITKCCRLESLLTEKNRRNSLCVYAHSEQNHHHCMGSNSEKREIM